MLPSAPSAAIRATTPPFTRPTSHDSAYARDAAASNRTLLLSRIASLYSAPAATAAPPNAATVASVVRE